MHFFFFIHYLICAVPGLFCAESYLVFPMVMQSYIYTQGNRTWQKQRVSTF